MRILILVALTALVGCHSTRNGDKPVVVEAEGWAPAAQGDPAASRRRALAEAKRAALEKAFGSAVSAAARVEKGVETDQRIEARVSGVIVRYKILDEMDGSGLHGLRLRAWVLRTERPEEAAEVVLPLPGDPGLSIRSSEGSEAERAEFGLRQGLADGGGRIVDRGAEEIVVTIRAGVKPLRNSDLAGLSSCRARASVRAVDARTGRVLAQLTQEASAVDLSSEGAAAKAAEKAGQAAGRALARRLGDALAGR